MLPLLLTPHQLGFTRNRHSTLGIRTAIAATVAEASLPRPKGILLGLDAEKAFDRIEWPWLNAILSTRAFGQIFSSYVQYIYSAPSSRIWVNNFLSDPILLQRGTRQGCPLSPLLFNLALDPLLRLLDVLPGFRGITVGSTEVWLTAFADNLLLYIGNPRDALPHIFKGHHAFWNGSRI